MQKERRNNVGVSVKTIGAVATIIIAVISTLLFGSLFLLSNKFNDVQDSTNDYMTWKDTALDVKDASDYLTDQVRYYVYNKHKIYMDNYFEEANVTKRREKAIAVIEEHLPDTEAHKGIEAAVKRSKELMLDEYYAMRLVVESLHITMDDTYPIEIKETILSEEDQLLSDAAKSALALDYVIGEKYLEDKEYIIQKVNQAVSEIDTMMEKDVISSTERLKSILIMQQILIALNIFIIGGSVFSIYYFMMRPINIAVERLRSGENMDETGAREYRYLASVYNAAKEQSDDVKNKLLYEAEHDQLTGLYNRTGYDAIYRRAKLDKCFYILIDIDFFKKVNDEYGHETGDKVLVKVAAIINKIFEKDNEFAFRLGGDEFSVLVGDNEGISVEDIKNKCQAITEQVMRLKNIPDVSLSIGIAVGEEDDTTDTLFRKADRALYSVKNNGRHNISVYEEK